MISLKVIGIAACIYVLLSSAVLLIMTSSVSYQYFSNDILIYSPSFKLTILFGCGICISVIIFIGLCIFIFFPKIKINYILTFPLFLFIPCIYIYFSKPGETEKFISNWSDLWDDTSIFTEEFQKKQKCCGWLNFSDRSIDPCPIDYQSGCKMIILNYLNPRFHDIFVSSIVALFFGTFSSVFSIVIYFVVPDHDIIRQLDIDI